MKFKVVCFIIFIFITSLNIFAFAKEKSFTLKSAVDYALENSPYIKYIKARADINKGEEIIAKSKLLPFADLSLNYTKFQKSHAVVLGVEPKKIEFDDDKYFGAVKFNYVLWDFKSRRLNYLAEKEITKSALENYEREKERFVYNVITVYLSNLNIVHNIKSTEEMYESVKKLYEKTKKKVQTGRKPLVDELKIKVVLSKVKDDLSKLKVLKTELYYNLKQLLGIEKENFNLLEVNKKDYKNQPEDKNKIITDAFKYRKDLKSIQVNLKALKMKLKSLKMSYLPEISINSELNEQSGDDKTFKGNDFIGFNLKMPIFDGGYRKGNIEKIRYQLISLTQLESNKKLEIKKDVETAVENYNSSKIRLENAIDTVKRAEEVLRIEKLKYSLGRTTIDFLLDAEASLLTAKSYYFKALYDQIMAYYNIKLAKGDI
jgi:outer membrane protein TolC